MKEELDWKQELLRICTILKNSGIDISNIQSRKTIDGKRCYTTIKDIKSENANIDDIIKTNDLDSNCEIGKYIKNFTFIYFFRLFCKYYCIYFKNILHYLYTIFK